jgi:hypothetical protein
MVSNDINDIFLKINNLKNILNFSEKKEIVDDCMKLEKEIDTRRCRPRCSLAAPHNREGTAVRASRDGDRAGPFQPGWRSTCLFLIHLFLSPRFARTGIGY